jgi:hypothetical protein
VLSAENPFYRHVLLLLELLPLVAGESCFALKGGTAINLFVRNLPRLSVDIDLTYVPIEGREESLNHIDKALPNWISPPTLAINKQPRDFEFVRFN